jgi:hypothetical protein
LLAALLLAWAHRHPADLATAVETALAGLQGVLRVTSAAVAAEERAAAAALAASADADGPPGQGLLSSRERSAAVFRAKELRLVQAQAEVVTPRVELRAEPLLR